MDRMPLPRALTAVLLVAVTNVLLHPLALVPVFEPSAMKGPLFTSGAELFYAIIWSSFAGTLISVLYAYSRRLKDSLREIGEIFELEPAKFQWFYQKFSGITIGAPCTIAGLLLGSIASVLFYFYVVPAMVGGGWYCSKAIHFAVAGLLFVDYMLAGSALWMLGSYLYLINRIRVYASQLPPITMLRRLKVFGVLSLHGAAYFALIGLIAISYSVGEQYFRVSWAFAVALLTTIFATVFPIVFFFVSLLGIHGIIVEVKEKQLDQVRNEYWQKHLDSRNIVDERSLAMHQVCMTELDNVARWIERMREWPFDLGILRHLALSGILPVVTYFLGDYLVKTLLGV